MRASNRCCQKVQSPITGDSFNHQCQRGSEDNYLRKIQDSIWGMLMVGHQILIPTMSHCAVIILTFDSLRYVFMIE